MSKLSLIGFVIKQLNSLYHTHFVKLSFLCTFHPFLSIIMPTKIITLICYWNRKIISDKKGIFYEGPTPVATIKRSQVTLHEFMKKVYEVIGYEKQYISLTVTGISVDTRF